MYFSYNVHCGIIFITKLGYKWCHIHFHCRRIVYNVDTSIEKGWSWELKQENFWVYLVIAPYHNDIIIIIFMYIYFFKYFLILVPHDLSIPSLHFCRRLGYNSHVYFNSFNMLKVFFTVLFIRYWGEPLFIKNLLIISLSVLIFCNNFIILISKFHFWRYYTLLLKIVISLKVSNLREWRFTWIIAKSDNVILL